MAATSAIGCVVGVGFPAYDMRKRCAVMAVGCCAGAANAVLVDEGSTMLDTVSGLEWLDRSFINGMSYAEVAA